MIVKDLMKNDIASCHIDANLEAIALLMWNHDCGSIPVVDSANKPIGIVTDRDIAVACSLNNRPLWDMRADDIINGRPLFSCTEEDDVVDALQLMRDHRVRRLPVTDAGEQLRGMLSVSDAIMTAQKRPSRRKTNQKLSFDDLMELLKAVSTPHRKNEPAPARYSS